MKNKNKQKVMYEGWEIRVHQVGIYSARKDGVILNGNSKADIYDQVDKLN